MDWVTLALISALFSAFAAILEKKILFQQKVLCFTMVLAVFNAILATGFLPGVNFSEITQIHIWVLLIKTLLSAAAFLCVMSAIQNLELSSALPLLVLTPGITAIVAFLLWQESLNEYRILGLVLLTIGVYLLNLGQNQKIWDPFSVFLKKPGLYISLALIFFTITSLLNRLLVFRQHLATNAFMVLEHYFLALIFLAIFIWQKNKLESLHQALVQSWPYFLALSIVTIIYRYAEIVAIQLAPAVALPVILKRISVFFAVVIGGKLFQESHILRKTIATMILLLGAFLVTR